MADTKASIISNEKHEIGGYCVVFDNPGVGLNWHKMTTFEFLPFEDLGVPILWCHAVKPFGVIGSASITSFQRDEIGIKFVTQLSNPALLKWTEAGLCAWSVGFDIERCILVGKDLIKAAVMEISLTMCPACPPDRLAKGHWRDLFGVEKIDNIADQQPITVPGSRCCLFAEQKNTPIGMLALTD